jgi:signal transduction histidine kinase
MVQEKQRKQISRRLHDEISQLLLSINVHLELFTKLAIRRPQGIRRSILPLRRLVEESVQVIHRFARDLRPAMLDDLGLIPALRAYISDFPQPRSLKVEFTADPGVEKLDNDKRTVLYRVAQESLANVVKHARAREAHVKLSKDRQGVSLEVSDNGRAFDPVQFLNSAWGERLGLIGMRERVEMVGGRFEIRSAPGQGTTIRAQVPFAKGNWSLGRRKRSA